MFCPNPVFIFVSGLVPWTRCCIFFGGKCIRKKFLRWSLLHRFCQLLKEAVGATLCQNEAEVEFQMHIDRQISLTAHRKSRGNDIDWTNSIMTFTFFLIFINSLKAESLITAFKEFVEKESKCHDWALFNQSHCPCFFCEWDLVVNVHILAEHFSF